MERMIKKKKTLQGCFSGFNPTPLQSSAGGEVSKGHLKGMINYIHLAGLAKTHYKSPCPGQVHFSSGQVTLNLICLMSIRGQASLPAKTCSEGKHNLRASCPKGKPKFKFF